MLDVQLTEGLGWWRTWTRALLAEPAMANTERNAFAFIAASVLEGALNVQGATQVGSGADEPMRSAAEAAMPLMACAFS